MFRHRNLYFSLQLNPNISGDFGLPNRYSSENEPLGAPVFSEGGIRLMLPV